MNIFIRFGMFVVNYRHSLNYALDPANQGFTVYPPMNRVFIGFRTHALYNNHSVQEFRCLRDDGQMQVHTDFERYPYEIISIEQIF